MPGIMVCGTLGCICTRQTGLGPHSRLVRSFAPPTRQGSAVLGRGCRRGSVSRLEETCRAMGDADGRRMAASHVQLLTWS